VYDRYPNNHDHSTSTAARRSLLPDGLPVQSNDNGHSQKAEFEKQKFPPFLRPRTEIAAQACERHTGQR
jgi:hypothetical protein